jgi:NADPH:quinone reductase-like Zn-dependent oxidoreductase
VATASGQTAQRAERCGAALVIDHRSPDWLAQVRDWTGSKGVDAAVNAVPGEAAEILDVVRDGGKLATITSDPPASVRGVRVREVYVSPDGARLGRLAELLASGAVNLEVTAV